MRSRRAGFWKISIFVLILIPTTSVRAQSTPPYYVLPSIGFEPTAAETLPSGIHYPVEDGPTGGPYRATEFFHGVTSTEGGGAWTLRDNVWGLCFNLVNCSGHRILPDLHDFAYTFEASYQGNADWPMLIENNFNMRYADGTFHRPWAMHVWHDQKAAVLNFSSKPNEVSFQVNQNGNTVIGTPVWQPIHQLEVLGDALVTEGLEVQGDVTVDGLPVLVGSASPTTGPMQWSLSDGAKLDSPLEACSAARLECSRGLLSTGEELLCSSEVPSGLVFFALCHSGS